MRARSNQDRGAILPLVLVVTVVLGLVVVAVANYTATGLRYGEVGEARAKRVASAQGAMDDALEQLSLRSSLCATAAGAAGIDVPFPETINDTDVVVTCRSVGGALPPAEGWAIVITEEGAPDDSTPTFEFTQGGRPDISGPVFLSNPHRASFSQPTTVEEGDVWYPDDACAVSVPDDDGTQFARSPVTLDKLSFEPTTRGIYCVNRTWDELFGTNLTVSPDVALYADGTNPAYLNPAPTPYGSCLVFEPGYYTSLPLDKHNYFRSGTYVFDDLGLVSLKGQTVTMGQVDRQQYPAIENHADCDDYRTTADLEPDNGGATLYTRGNTRFETLAGSGFEVSGRLQSGATVAVQVLDSTLGYHIPFMQADNGAKKQISLQGLLWAPYNSLVFATVPAQKAAVLRGGAVIASFRGGVTSAAEGFVIQVPTSAGSTRLLLEAVATDRRAANIVRVVADYRPSTGEVAVNSRRVL